MEKIAKFLEKIKKRIDTIKKEDKIFYENEKIFKEYFKKNFYYYYLILANLFFFVLTIVVGNFEYSVYDQEVYFIFTKQKQICTATFYCCYLFFCNFLFLFTYFFLALYVTYKAKSPKINVYYQIIKHFMVLTVGSLILAYLYIKAPILPDAFTYFIHTNLPFGRGFDYVSGDLGLKLKGGVLLVAIGQENTLKAVLKHSPNSRIVNNDVLLNIINDPEFNHAIMSSISVAEKAFLCI